LHTMTTSLISTVAGRSLAARIFGGICATLLAVHSAHAVEKTEKVIETSVGKKFTIVLEANPTTGYGWQLENPVDEAMVKAIKNEYQTTPQPANDKKPMVGVGGQEIWTFKALKPGKTVIGLKYVRSWEKGKAPEKTASFQIMVKDAAGAVTPAPDHEPIIKEGAELSLKGKLKGGMMGIGGETTGWVLTYQTKSGPQTIDVDCSALDAEKTPEGGVRVTGKIFKKDYVERGPTLVLKATKVEKLP
jgi:inhibitor of cysteine peptidase